MAKKTTEKSRKSKQDEGLSLLQKIVLGVVLVSIPIGIFIVLPLMTRSRLSQSLRIPPEVLVGIPLKLDMGDLEKSQLDSQQTIHLFMKGTEFQIPRAYTAVRISPEVVTFRKNPRRISGTISVSVKNESPKLDLKTSGIISVFMPGELRPFLESALWATWNPVRLYCKAQFLVSQGIGSSVFVTDWDAHHKGFVFPTPGNTGYLARIFSDKEDHYIEVAYFDETEPVKLVETDPEKQKLFPSWTSIALRLKPPYEPVGSTASPPVPQKLSLAATLSRVGDVQTAPTALQDSLNQYYLTGSASWLLPCALIMENREYFRDAIDLCGEVIPQSKEDPQQMALWKDLFERCVNKVLKIEIDPHLELNQVTVFAKNLSQYPLRQIKLRINSVEPLSEHSFTATVQNEGTMQPQDERTFMVLTEPGFLTKKIQGISWTVESLEIGD